LTAIYHHDAHRKMSYVIALEWLKQYAGKSLQDEASHL